jgi:hypothetical protein
MPLPRGSSEFTEGWPSAVVSTPAAVPVSEEFSQPAAPADVEGPAFATACDPPVVPSATKQQCSALTSAIQLGSVAMNPVIVRGHPFKTAAIDSESRDHLVTSLALLSLPYLAESATLPSFVNLPTQFGGPFLSRIAPQCRFVLASSDTQQPPVSDIATSIFHPLASDETVQLQVVESEPFPSHSDQPQLNPQVRTESEASPSQPRRSPHFSTVYRCRVCGRPKKGHICMGRRR